MVKRGENNVSRKKMAITIYTIAPLKNILSRVYKQESHCSTFLLRDDGSLYTKIVHAMGRAALTFQTSGRLGGVKRVVSVMHAVNKINLYPDVTSVSCSVGENRASNEVSPNTLKHTHFPHLVFQSTSFVLVVLTRWARVLLFSDLAHFVVCLCACVCVGVACVCETSG